VSWLLAIKFSGFVRQAPFTRRIGLGAKAAVSYCEAVAPFRLVSAALKGTESLIIGQCEGRAELESAKVSGEGAGGRLSRQRVGKGQAQAPVQQNDGAELGVKVRH